MTTALLLCRVLKVVLPLCRVLMVVLPPCRVLTARLTLGRACRG